MKCPSFEQLIDSIDNRLAKPEAARVAAHLAGGCAACVEARDWYEQVRSVTANDDSVTPPAWVFKRAVRIFDKASHPSKLAAFVGDLIASLVFDSFARPALVGVRSTETVNRQLLYRAGDHSIDLQIIPTEHTNADLIGQVLKESDPTFESVSGLKLGVTRGGKLLFSAMTDARGEFKITGIEHGVYDLRVDLSDGTITVPDIPVSES
jgi:hypothetical protein